MENGIKVKKFGTRYAFACQAASYNRGHALISRKKPLLGAYRLPYLFLETEWEQLFDIHKDCGHSP